MPPWRKREPAPAPPAGDGPPVDLDVTSTPYGAIVSVAGDLDLATVPRLRAELAAEPVAGAEAVVVDLAGVTFMDSTGLSALLELERDLTARGGRLAIACPEGAARLLFDVAGVTGQLALYWTRDDAEAAALL